MKNTTYDKIKNFALLVAPILTFASALVEIWGVPFGAQITATIAALDVCLGAIVVVAKKIYENKNKEDSIDE